MSSLGMLYRLTISIRIVIDIFGYLHTLSCRRVKKFSSFHTISKTHLFMIFSQRLGTHTCMSCIDHNLLLDWMPRHRMYHNAHGVILAVLYNCPRILCERITLPTHNYPAQLLSSYMIISMNSALYN